MSTSKPVAVVAGAGRQGSIGWAVVDRLLAEGYRVVASDIGGSLDTHADYEVAPPGHLLERVEREDPADFAVQSCDVTQEDEVARLFTLARERFGAVDVAVNCAGLGIGLTPVTDLTLRDWEVNIRVMATGAFLFAREAARTMTASRTPGRIVSISSQAGKTGQALLSAYSAAKFAVIGLTQSLAAELGPQGITVNAICPGTIDTPLLAVKGGVYDAYGTSRGMSVDEYRERQARRIPARRFGLPEDVANAVSFLVRPESSFVTGVSLNVAGGEEVH